MTREHHGRLGRAAAVAALALAALLAPSVPAAAGPPATGRVHVWIDGWGSGRVTSSPAGIDCHLISPPGYPYESAPGDDQHFSGPCWADFTLGTTVTMTATPDARSSGNYLDCGSGSAPPCRRVVTAGYNPVWAMFCPVDGLCSAG